MPWRGKLDGVGLGGSLLGSDHDDIDGVTGGVSWGEGRLGVDAIPAGSGRYIGAPAGMIPCDTRNSGCGIKTSVNFA